MNEIMASGLVVGVLAMIFWTPFLMCRGLSKMYDSTGTVDTILCLIPVFNLIRAEKIYFGYIRWMLLAPVLLVAGVAARFYIWMNMYDNVMLGTVSIVIFWAVILFYLICNIRFVYSVINDAQAVTGAKLFLLAIFYPFGQYYIGAYLTNVVRHMKQQEATFKV